jgi:prepilin-type N-terminal cleavage/methylation domain-containing protein
VVSKIYKELHLHQPLSFRQGKAGFTLLEVMIALAIIGITLAVVIHTVNYHAEIMYQDTITTQMYQLAMERMHELEENRANASGSLGTDYTFENRVTKVEDSEILELKTTVRGRGKEVSLTELVVKKQNQFRGQGSGVGSESTRSESQGSAVGSESTRSESQGS